MRIVYDYGPRQPNVPHSSPAEQGRKETVLVISRKDVTGMGGPSAAHSPGGLGGRDGVTEIGDGYVLALSPEARERDREVRAHENSHLAALGGAAASPIMYDTVAGPGGERVAVGGKVAVDLAEVPGDPRATLRKAKTIIAAANAPAEPSAADLRTAAAAYRLAGKAAEELRQRGTA